MQVMLMELPNAPMDRLVKDFVAVVTQNVFIAPIVETGLWVVSFLFIYTIKL